MQFLFASGFSDSIEILKEYGPVVGILLLTIAFFMWRDWKREDTLTSQIVQLQLEVRSILIPLVKDCTDTIARNSLVSERNSNVLDRVERRLDEV